MLYIQVIPGRIVAGVNFLRAKALLGFVKNNVQLGENTFLLKQIV